MALTQIQEKTEFNNLPMNAGIDIPGGANNYRNNTRNIIGDIRYELKRMERSSSDDEEVTVKASSKRQYRGDEIQLKGVSKKSSQSTNDSMIRPGSGSRPGSGPRPGSGFRPGSSSRPSSAGRPYSGDRPSSALARGVQITEFKDLRVNPDPIFLEETDILLEEYLSPRKLKLLTGCDDLDSVKYLEMRVDTTETSLGNFGALLPNLSQLKLSNSIITCVRDLGSSFNTLHVLWMSRSCVEDLDGLFAMTNLQELYLAYNEISELGPCAMMDKLKILDLEGNNINDLSQVEFLALCQRLTNLTLEGNPICLMPHVDALMPDYDYRQSIKRCIPHLYYLDDAPLVESKGILKKSSSAFDEDWKLIQQLMDEGAMDSSESLDNPELGIARPVTARPVTGYRPGSALKPTTAMKRPGSASRPKTSNRPSTAAAPTDESAVKEDDSSDLTMGTVVCGNPSKALRARSKLQRNIPEEPPKLFGDLRFKPEHTYDALLEEEEDINDLSEIVCELKEWRMDHNKRLRKIEESRAPQVLKIDHDESVTLSDEEIDSDDDEVTLREDDDRDTKLDVSCSTDSGVGLSRQSSSPTVSSGPTPTLIENKQSPPSPKPPSQDQGVNRPRSSAGIRSKHLRIRSEENRDIQSPSSGGESPNPIAQYSQSADNVQSHSVGVTASESVAPRPASNPVGGTRKFKYGPEIDKKNLPKNIDKSNPVIRVSVKTPERPLVPQGPRAITSKAVLDHTSAKSRMRRQLPLVPSLPSKPSMPK